VTLLKDLQNTDMSLDDFREVADGRSLWRSCIAQLGSCLIYAQP